MLEIRPLPMGEVKRSIPGISLFRPGIAAVVIAAHFPIARRVLATEFDALQPFGALPEIERPHDEAHRAAVLLLQRLPGPAMREQAVLGGQGFPPYVGGLAVMGIQHHETCLTSRTARRPQTVGGS